MTRGATWAKQVRLKIRLKTFFFGGGGGGGEKRTHFLLEHEREIEKGRGEGFQSFFRQSTEFYRSEFVGLRTKVHLRMGTIKEGFHRRSKGRDFAKSNISS